MAFELPQCDNLLAFVASLLTSLVAFGVATVVCCCCFWILDPNPTLNRTHPKPTLAPPHPKTPEFVASQLSGDQKSYEET